MDLYLFYNCLCNLDQIFSKDEDKLTLEDEKLFNNPMVLYNYYNNSLYQTGGVAPAVAAAVAGPAVKAALANPGNNDGSTSCYFG